jgi:catechol O-methyltransferase
MSMKRRLPFLRSSFWRLAVSMPHFVRTGQIGDGREEACAAYVEANAQRGDVDDVLATIDTFATEMSMLVNVGDEKGALLDAAVRRVDPKRVLELGTYCGYSALRIAGAAPEAQVYSVELSPANAEVAQRIWTHAGVDDRVVCVVGTIGDGGQTLDALSNEHGLRAGSVDLLFIDHEKSAICRICRPFWAGAGCTKAPWPSPTTCVFRVPPSTAAICVRSRARCGTPSSTRPTSSTRR